MGLHGKIVKIFLNMIDKLRKITKNIWLFFLDLIFPIECLGCESEGSWLCAECFMKIKLKSGQYCLNCKKENNFGEFCPPCQILYSLKGVWIATLYDEKIISQAIKSLKYHFVSSLANDLGKLLILFTDSLLRQSKILKPSLVGGLDRRLLGQAKSLPAVILDFKNCLIIPVPLSAKRRRWRGFNQAEIIAKVFANNYGLEMDDKNLIRVKHKKPQAKLNEIRRLENIKDCFDWRGGDLNKKNIILIDDVVTTGATLNECAKVLKAHGAGEVWALVIAKG
jgi:competence protein ComFC